MNNNLQLITKLDIGEREDRMRKCVKFKRKVDKCFKKSHEDL